MDDDHNKLCDLLTQLVVSALPPEDRKNTEKISKLADFVFNNSSIPSQVAALILLGKL